MQLNLFSPQVGSLKLVYKWALKKKTKTKNKTLPYVEEEERLGVSLSWNVILRT